VCKGSLLGSASRSVGGGGGRSVAQRPKRRSRRPPMPVSFGSVFIRMYCSELDWIQVFRVWCFAEKWSMHVCECKRLPMWTDVRMSIRLSLTWLQGTDSVPSAIAPGMTGESHSHPLAHGKTGD